MTAQHLVEHNQTPVTAPRVWVAASASATAIANPPRALLITTSGTIDIEDENGTAITGLAVSASERPVLLSPTKITDITDAVVWLCY